MAKSKVLVPLDGSEFSRQILGHVRRFLDPADNDLVLLRVARPPRGLVGAPAQPVTAEWPQPMYRSQRDAEYAKHPIYADQMRQGLSGSIAEELEADAHPLRQAGYAVSVAVRFGEPAEEILRFIESEGVQLVAMTTHGRTGLRRLIFGSVAEQVLRRVVVPVLLFCPLETADRPPG